MLENGAEVDDVVEVGVRGPDDVDVARRTDRRQRDVVVVRVDDLPAFPQPLFLVVIRRGLRQGRFCVGNVAVLYVAGGVVLRVEERYGRLPPVRVDRLVLQRIDAHAPPDGAEGHVPGRRLAEAERVDRQGTVRQHLEPPHEGVGAGVVNVAVHGIGGLV